MASRAASSASALALAAAFSSAALAAAASSGVTLSLSAASLEALDVVESTAFSSLTSSFFLRSSGGG